MVKTPSRQANTVLCTRRGQTELLADATVFVTVFSKMGSPAAGQFPVMPTQAPCESAGEDSSGENEGCLGMTLEGTWRTKGVRHRERDQKSELSFP